MAPNMLLVSVIATAGMLFVVQSLGRALTWIAPSDSEKAECTRKWMKPGLFAVSAVAGSVVMFCDCWAGGNRM